MFIHPARISTKPGAKSAAFCKNRVKIAHFGVAEPRKDSDLSSVPLLELNDFPHTALQILNVDTA